MPELFTCPFCYTPHPLAVRAAGEVQRHIETISEWADELAQGKMFGVLVATDDRGRLGFLAAFSGNIAGRSVHNWFVPPIFDITLPDGRFKTEERAISAINSQIDNLTNSEHYRLTLSQLADMKRQSEAEISQTKAAARQHKAERATLRLQPLTTDQALELERQSQFEKAELKRLERRWEAKIAACEAKATNTTLQIEQLKEQRRQRSESLQRWLFEQYLVRNALGESRTIGRIFAAERGTMPPAATGECAAPKLLQYAFNHGFAPVAMAEFWWGGSPIGEVRRHGQFYPACHSKCEPLLNFMLQGMAVEPNRLKKQEYTTLRILYNDKWLAAVEKPSGLPTVPGKEHQVSAYSIVRQMFPDASGPLVAHRLDMDTSGILLIAKSKEVFVSLQRQFVAHKVTKRYVALLDGIVACDSGIISLPLCPNLDDRPRQMVDFEHGKEAVTMFTVIGRRGGQTLVDFRPETGRTHQLRVHAAHQSGLNCPIVGDNLYGRPAERLMLHATEIKFMHPQSGQMITIVSEVPF